MTEEYQKRVTGLAAQLYLKLIPTLVYDDQTSEQVAHMAYDAAKDFYAVVATRLIEESKDAGA
jgi:hypothetical protein